MAGVFTSRHAARITGLSPAQVRSCARSGLLSAGPSSGYSFGDLLLLRAARRLFEGGVPLRRIRRALGSLRSAGAGHPPVTRLALSVDRGQIVVASSGVRWHPESGQLVLDFNEGQPLAAKVARLIKPRSKLTPDQ